MYNDEDGRKRCIDIDFLCEVKYSKYQQCRKLNRIHIIVQCSWEWYTESVSWDTEKYNT